MSLLSLPLYISSHHFVVPAPNRRAGKTFNTYVKTELYYHREIAPPSAGGADAEAVKNKKALEEVVLKWRSKTQKVQHNVDTGADGFWNESFEWEYERDELAFFRCVSFLISKSLSVDSFPQILDVRGRIREGRQGVDVLFTRRSARLGRMAAGKADGHEGKRCGDDGVGKV